MTLNYGLDVMDNVGQRIGAADWSKPIITQVTTTYNKVESLLQFETAVCAGGR